MQKEQFSIETYKSFNEEIKMRLDIHFKLVLAKFSLCGALFAFMASIPNMKVSPYLVAALFAFLFDVVIIENLGTVRLISHLIKNGIETTKLPIIKWERASAQTVGYLCGVWSIGALFILGYFILEFNPQDRVNIVLFFGVLYLAVYSIFLCWRNLQNIGKPRGYEFIV